MMPQISGSGQDRMPEIHYLDTERQSKQKDKQIALAFAECRQLFGKRRLWESRSLSSPIYPGYGEEQSECKKLSE
jgi:hypothetical protein